MKIENKQNARFLSYYNVNFLAAKIRGEQFWKILKKKDRQSHKGKRFLHQNLFVVLWCIF